ncbi:phage capsid protein [Sphingomonas flavalba]|uniref:phage capsid protein n=1 Tax=Sphingomonas flavalba TaxID=2559804 RepID=UPI0039E0918A
MAIPGTPQAIETTQTVEYRLAVTYELNEKPGKLDILCGSRGSYSDKMAQIEDRFDDLVAEERTERNADTRNTDMDVTRRWIMKPRPKDVSPLLDRTDMATTKLDLKSPASVQTAKAIRRAHDDAVIAGFFGNAWVGAGENSLSSVPFKSANIMAADYGAGAATGLTLEKLIGMQQMMEAALVDMEEEQPIILITSKQKADLLRINQVQSRDYNPLLQQALQTGKVADFMGFRFLQTEFGNQKAYPKSFNLSVPTAGQRALPVLVPSAMHRGSWEEFFGRVSERADKSYSWQIYGETCVAATRVNEDKAFQILVTE